MSLTKILTTYSGRKKSIKSVVEKNNLKSMIICKNLLARPKAGRSVNNQGKTVAHFNK